MSFGEAHTTRLQKGIFAGQAESHNPERLAVPFDDKQCLAVRRACLVGNAGRAVPLVAPPRLHHLSGEEPLSSSVPITVSTRSSNSPSRTSRKEQDSSTVPRGLQRERCLGGPGRSRPRHGPVSRPAWARSPWRGRGQHHPPEVHRRSDPITNRSHRAQLHVPTKWPWPPRCGRASIMSESCRFEPEPRSSEWPAQAPATPGSSNGTTS